MTLYCTECGLESACLIDGLCCRTSACTPQPATHHQSRADSIIEVAVNIAIGAAVSLGAQVIIFPLYGIHASAGQHVGIVGAFTLVSVLRQYLLRRAFNGKSPWRWFRDRSV